MSNPNPIGSPESPDLRSLIDGMITNALLQTYVAQPGKIVSFDSSKQTCQVQLLFNRLFPDRTSSPPVYVEKVVPPIIDVPVFVSSGGTGRITFPINAGDPCLVIFADRDIDKWFQAGTPAAPNSTRNHDLSDGFALIGFRNQSNLIANYNATQTELRGPNNSRLTLDSKIRLEGQNSSLLSVLTLLVAALTALNGKTGPSAAVQIASLQAEIVLLMQ